MNIAAEKNEIIEWINSIDNPAVLEKIKQVKHETIAFDFEKEWKKGVSINIARENSRKFISLLNWAK